MSGSWGHLVNYFCGLIITRTLPYLWKPSLPHKVVVRRHRLVCARLNLTVIVVIQNLLPTLRNKLKIIKWIVVFLFWPGEDFNCIVFICLHIKYTYFFQCTVSSPVCRLEAARRTSSSAAWVGRWWWRCSRAGRSGTQLRTHAEVSWKTSGPSPCPGSRCCAAPPTCRSQQRFERSSRFEPFLSPPIRYTSHLQVAKPDNTKIPKFIKKI